MSAWRPCPIGADHRPSDRRFERTHGLCRQALAAVTDHGFGRGAVPHRRSGGQTRRGGAGAGDGPGGPAAGRNLGRAAGGVDNGWRPGRAPDVGLAGAGGARSTAKKRVFPRSNATRRKAWRGAFLGAIQGEGVTRFELVDEAGVCVRAGRCPAAPTRRRWGRCRATSRKPSCPWMGPSTGIARLPRAGARPHLAARRRGRAR